MGWNNGEDALRRLKQTECFLLGMDGTVCLGDELIPGSLDFIDRLQKAGRQVLILTNNSSHDARFYRRALKEQGCLVEHQHIITSGRAAAELLNRRHPGERVYVLGNEYLKDELNEAGVQVVKSNFSVMLAGFDTTLTYETLTNFCAGVNDGKPYYATHEELRCPAEGGDKPNIGSILAFIEAATGRRPDAYAGKPERLMLNLALRLGGCTADRTAICGDSLRTEMEAGNRDGLLTILLLSGLATLHEAETAVEQQRPDLVFASLADIPRQAPEE